MILQLRSFLFVVAVILIAGMTAQTAHSQGNSLKSFPNYVKVSGISGNINSAGSDTMLNMMTLWCEGFTKVYPNVRCQIEGKGSGTAPPALIEGTVQFGCMSRQMKPTEVDKFESKFGYKPTQIKTSLDTIAVYVNKDNPIKGLTIDQVDAIYSRTRKCGGPEDIVTWGQLGLSGDWAGRPISLYGRNSASGTRGYFKKKALCKGDYKDEVREQPGSASVVQSVTEDRYGIGYSGIGYRTSGVRVVPLAKRNSTVFAKPNAENALNGSYPLGRFLYVYINKAPQKSLDPLVSEFMKFILSRQGQQIVAKAGYDPMPASIAAGEKAKVK